MVSTLQPKLYWVTPDGVAKDEALKLKTAELKTAFESLKNQNDAVKRLQQEIRQLERG